MNKWNLINADSGEKTWLTKDYCTYFREMEYVKDIKEHKCSHIIARGEYKGFKFLCVNTKGHNPCGYVDVVNTKFNGKHYDDINIDCHGGITFAEDFSPVSCERGWWIGWDYAHLGDFMPSITVYADNEVKHTTGEVVSDCLSVIDQIVEMDKNGIEVAEC